MGVPGVFFRCPGGWLVLSWPSIDSRGMVDLTAKWDLIGDYYGVGARSVALAGDVAEAVPRGGVAVRAIDFARDAGLVWSLVLTPAVASVSVPAVVEGDLPELEDSQR